MLTFDTNGAPYIGGEGRCHQTRPQSMNKGEELRDKSIKQLTFISFMGPSSA